MSNLFIIAVRSSRLFVKGSALRDHDKKPIPFYTVEPAEAKSFTDEYDAKDYLDKLVAGNRKLKVEPYG
jgi:hypothetical protein